MTGGEGGGGERVEAEGRPRESKTRCREKGRGLTEGMAWRQTGSGRLALEHSGLWQVQCGAQADAGQGLTHPRPPAKTACVQLNDAGTAPPRHHSSPRSPSQSQQPLLFFDSITAMFWIFLAPPMTWPYAMDSTTHPHPPLIPNRPSFGEPLRRVPVQRPHLLPYTKCPSASGCSGCVHALSSPGPRFGRAGTRRRCGRGGAGLAPAASTVMRLLSQMSMPSPVRQPSGQSQAPARGRSSILCLGMKRKRAAARRSGPCHQPIVPFFPLLPTLSSIGCRGRRRRSLCSLPRCAGPGAQRRRRRRGREPSSMFPNQPPCPRHGHWPRRGCKVSLRCSRRITSMDHRCTDSSSPPSRRDGRAMAIAPSDECESMLFLLSALREPR